jgi:hypothetical protein
MGSDNISLRRTWFGPHDGDATAEDRALRGRSLSADRRPCERQVGPLFGGPASPCRCKSKSDKSIRSFTCDSNLVGGVHF